MYHVLHTNIYLIPLAALVSEDATLGIEAHGLDGALLLGACLVLTICGIKTANTARQATCTSCASLVGGCVVLLHPAARQPPIAGDMVVTHAGDILVKDFPSRCLWNDICMHIHMYIYV